MTDFEGFVSICQVKVVGPSTATSQPPVRLPLEAQEAVNPPPRAEMYDFALEKEILKKLQDRECDQMLGKATSREELEKATVTKMKHATGAKEELCIAMLESNGYDLKTSVEAYLR
eukprot:Nitzschia sp. Nitz4//scaffold89_size161592//148518//148987//NITZ4_002403-RA/size161592-snap-gene-0.183-mRNA-1//-1//CDS//3329559691//5152//frame0